MADVNTSAFMLSSATVMLGQALVDDVFSLTPDKHSVGMVSEVNINLDSSLNELLNGVSQSAVDSKRTGLATSITANIFEMTARNFLRAQSMVGQSPPVRRGRLVFDAAAGASSISLISNPIPGDGESALTSVADLPTGSTVLIQRVDDTAYVFPVRTTGAATQAGPVYTVPVSIPAGMSFPSGSQVWVVDPVPVGDIDANAYYCLKVSGVLSNFNRPVVYVAPKVRLVKGFNIGFTETQYSSMAWEFRASMLTAGEVASVPRLREIGRRRSGMLLAAAGGGRVEEYVPPQPITLSTLTLSAPIRSKVASSGTVVGGSVGSTIASQLSGLTIDNATRSYSWDGTGPAGLDADALVETHPNATNSGRLSPLTVAAAYTIYNTTATSDLRGDAVDGFLTGADQRAARIEALGDWGTDVVLNFEGLSIAEAFALIDETLDDLEAAPALGPLNLSITSAPSGKTVSIDILGTLPGSGLVGSVPDGTALTSATRKIGGTLTTEGVTSVTLVETLDGARNSPRRSIIDFTTLAPAAAVALTFASRSTRWSTTRKRFSGGSSTPIVKTSFKISGALDLVEGTPGAVTTSFKVSGPLDLVEGNTSSAQTSFKISGSLDLVEGNPSTTKTSFLVSGLTDLSEGNPPATATSFRVSGNLDLIEGS